MKIMWLIAIALATLAGGVARAHELTPALLALSEVAPDEFDVLLRVPRESAGALTPLLPEQAVRAGEDVGAVDAVGFGPRVTRLRVVVPGGLAGKKVGVAGPSGVVTDVLVRVAFRDGRVVTGRTSPGGDLFEVPGALSAAGIAGAYLRLGVEHILTGFDHLLFVFGLLLLTRSRRALFFTITAFTAAHSLTLALAALGVLRVPGPPVEAVIALSIVFVAREVVHAQNGRARSDRPWPVAFAFGLLHGLGFAGALGQIGLPPREIPVALLAFNVGVELGQLAFVFAVSIAAVALPVRLRAALPAPVTRAPAYVLGGVAVFLCLQRIAAFR